MKIESIELTAIQFVGNDKECMDFCSLARDPIDKKPNLIIPTDQGEKLCNYGDYIVKTKFGSFHVMSEEDFLYLKTGKVNKNLKPKEYMPLAIEMMDMP